MNLKTQLIEAEPIVRRIAKDAEAATEIYQDLWVACLSRGGVDWSTPQVGRIVRIAQRLKVNRVRRELLRRWKSIDLVSMEEFASICRFDRNSCETLEHLLDSLKRLPNSYASAISQKYLLNEPDFLLAAKMNVDVATIRKWRSRGIRELKRELFDQELKSKQCYGASK